MFFLLCLYSANMLMFFRSVAQKYAQCFHADKTQNLITRLHHNVLRTGLRRINIAYSRISLSDIAAKLGLESNVDTEHVVAKAIRCDLSQSVISSFVCVSEMAVLMQTLTTRANTWKVLKLQMFIPLKNHRKHSMQELLSVWIFIMM